MPVFEKHVFVCTNERPHGHVRGCCAARDAGAIRERLKELIKQRGLSKRIRVNTAGCLDQCEHGVTAVVYPEAVWYGFLTMSDVDELVESHMVRGIPLERLRLPPECINTERCRHRGGGAVHLGLPR